MKNIDGQYYGDKLEIVVVCIQDLSYNTMLVYRFYQKLEFLEELVSDNMLHIFETKP